MALTLDFVFGVRDCGGRSSPCRARCVLLFAVLFLATITSSSDVYSTTTSTATDGNSSLASTDIIPTNSSAHSGAVSTATVTTSIGAEVVEEFGCENTEFRLTCRELDSTIAILDARFYPSELLAFSIDPNLNVKADDIPSPNDTAQFEDERLRCPAPKEWVEAGQWARVVGPDEAPVVDPAFENYSLPWPIQPGPGEYHFRLALNHRCSGVNHCSFILASDFEEARHLWGAGAVLIRYACMRHGQHVVRYCNEHVIAGASYSNKAGTQWKGMDRRRKGEAEREEAMKGDEWYADEEEDANEGWAEGHGFIASPGYPKYYIGGRPAGGVGERKACEWVIRPRYPGQRVQVTLLDVSLRGVAHSEEGCSDWVEVTAVQERRSAGEQGVEERILLTGCGEAPEAVKIESPEEAPGLRIALLSNSGSLFPKRGILFHYKAVGCRWPPPSPPKDGYLVSRNTTVAQYMCCVGYRFPDSGSRERELYCDEQRGLWRVRVPHQNPFPLKFLLPDCIDAETIFWGGNGTKKVITYLNENSTFSEKNAMLQEADFMLDVLVPALIIGILLLGNGVILYIIFHFKKRSLENEVPEEELRISQNGLNSTTGKPSDV